MAGIRITGQRRVRQARGAQDLTTSGMECGNESVMTFAGLNSSSLAASFRSAWRRLFPPHLPALRSAESSESGRLVAPMTSTGRPLVFSRLSESMHVSSCATIRRSMPVAINPSRVVYEVKVLDWQRSSRKTVDELNRTSHAGLPLPR